MDIIENQRTSGPVNAHLTPGPGIYFNAFIHVYSPRAGTDNSLGTNVDANRKPFLKYDFKHIKMISYMYIAPGQGQTTPWGQNFYVNKFFIPFVTSLKKKSL